MSDNEKKRDFIPALKFHWATRFYDPLVRRTTREFVFKKALIRAANLKENQTLLDLACGTGTLSLSIKRNFPKIEITALDADPEILLTARKKAQAGGMRVNFVQGFSDCLPFEKCAFDRVFSTLSFHHLTLTEKIKTLSEIRRVLKPLGEFHLADFGQPNGFAQKILGKTIALIDGRETTRDNLQGRLGILLAESGFAKIERTGSFQTILGTIRMFKASR